MPYPADICSKYIVPCQIKALIGRLEKAADKDLGAGMPNDLCSKAKDLSPAAAKSCRQLPKARVIASGKAVGVWGERGNGDGGEAACGQGSGKKLGPKTK